MCGSGEQPAAPGGIAWGGDRASGGEGSALAAVGVVLDGLGALAATDVASVRPARKMHHIRPRRLGGITKLPNLLLLCAFHHLILVHTWGWSITLNADGTTTMTSPDGTRVYHSHSPPPTVAA